jgi:hypothetical protein
MRKQLIAIWNRIAKFLARLTRNFRSPWIRKKMTKFYRIMSEEERQVIRQNKTIPTSRDGCNWYPANSVVFLFDTSAPCMYPEKEQIDAIVAAQGGHQWKLEFEAELAVEPDESGWANLRGVVHRGPINLDTCKNITWTQLR